MADRLIRLAIQAGVIAAVVAALPYKVFELDRYFVPKELVLHVAALIIALVLVARRRTLSFDVVDGLIAFFLLWSVASAIFATNHWVAQRSVAISVSSAIVFWGARSVAARGSYRPILIAAATAAVIAAALSLIAFVLILPLGRNVILLSFCALFLAVSYPFTKRFFALPQAYLGVAFGFGIPMAYAAHTGTVPPIGWVLLLANIAWTIAYDTEYAMVDRADDVKLGIKTSAILFGRFDVAAVMLCHGVFLAIMCWVGWRLSLAWPYYAGLACAAVLVAYQYFLIRGRDRERCFRAFLDNNWLGFVVFVGIVLAGLMPVQ